MKTPCKTQKYKIFHLYTLEGADQLVVADYWVHFYLFLAFFKQIVWIFYLLTLSPFIPGRPGGPGRPGRPGSPLGPYKKKICTSEKSKHLSKDKEKKCPAQAPLTPCLEVTVVKLSIASHSLRRVCVCAILPLITVRLSEECQENRELFQPRCLVSPYCENRPCVRSGLHLFSETFQLNNSQDFRVWSFPLFGFFHSKFLKKKIYR